MTVMFQEEVSKLRLQIVELNEAQFRAERDHQALAGKLTDAQQAARTAEKQVSTLKSDLEATRVLLATAQRNTEHLQNMESELAYARSNLKETDDQLATAKIENQKLKTDLNSTKANLNIARNELTRALEQITPLEALVAALKDRERASKVITGQLELLRLDGS